ncbi:hypothetical protein [Nocardiopsis dassonvillei]|jgi:hypothetical protein|uniref:hypothetical protein n=1 Tax=Nocardiopsis dassonvillei TaxID=2014 RepID=UPI00362A01A2
MTPQQPNQDSPSSGHVNPRTAVILLLAVASGALIGYLRWTGGDHFAMALAIALPSAGVAFFGFDKLIR